MTQQYAYILGRREAQRSRFNSTEDCRIVLQDFGDQIPTLLPFLITAFVLLIWALMDLFKRPSSGYRWGNRTIWAFIVLALTIIGPLLYLAVARKNDID